VSHTTTARPRARRGHRDTSALKRTQRGPFAAAAPRSVFGVVLAVALCLAVAARAQELPPELTQPVNDFTGRVDAESARQMDTLIRSLEQKTGDAVVVAVIDTFAPYDDIRDYAIKMFENRGKGIGQRARDNGVLILVAIKDRRAYIEVGYDLEQFITDGYAGETVRQTMAPHFRNDDYGAGLVAGVSRIIGRIAEGRNVTLDGVKPEPRRRARQRSGSGAGGIIALFVLIIMINAIAGSLRRRRRRSWWGGGPWSGWSSGVGPFGGGSFGGFGGGGGGGGGGFGGGFGGFGGGRSGGGGGGGSW
jgi:uncharacterized protein